jgi:isoleucyl-tRNA synthetase
MNGVAPYKACLTHGFTVDAKGRKMSKSLGNDMGLPQKAIKTLGADVLRLWVAATDYRAEMSMSEEILTRTTDAYRRLRNTARYLLANLDGFDPADCLPADEMLALDRWLLEEGTRLHEDVIAAYESCNFHLIYQRLHQFCVVELSSFYLDVLKDRMYTMPRDSRARRSAQTAMYHILEALVRWLAPVLSFTAEEIWSFMPGTRGASVFLESWYDRWPKFGGVGNMDQAYWEEIIAVRQAVAQHLERLRVAGGIGSSLDAEVDLYCGPELAEKLNRLGDELRFIFIVSYARVHPRAERAPEAQESAVPGLFVAVAPSGHPKCIRCWHHRDDVGRSKDHPQLCSRCVQNVTGSGESRSFA